MLILGEKHYEQQHNIVDFEGESQGTFELFSMQEDFPRTTYGS